MRSNRSEGRRAGDAATATAPAPGDRPPLSVKRLNGKPVVIAGAALLFVLLAVVFFVTSRPAADSGDVDVAALGGDPTEAATADFLNTDPTAAAPPGPDCQGLDCAAAVAAGQQQLPAEFGGGVDAGAAQYGTQAAPYADPYAAQMGGPDPFAVQYAPAPAAPAPALEQQECGRSCRFRQAREARLRGDQGAAGQQQEAARPSYQPDATGLMPESYYAAMRDSVLTADLAQHYGITPDALGRRDSGQNRPGGTAGATVAVGASVVARSPYVVSAGTLIPASLVTGINSDLCGDVKAVVTRDVYDARIRTVLIPAGSELLGTCDNQVATGQARLAIAWTHLRFPDGRGLTLPGLPAHSGSGASGVRDRVNNHWGRVFGTAILLSAVGAGAQLAIPQDAEEGLSPAATAATAAAATLTELATEILRKNVEVKPTIEIRPATPFVVFVAADLDVGAPSRRGGGAW